MTAPQKEYERNCFLTAGECNPQRQIPLALLTERLIETATEHANLLGIGYSELIKHRMAWVLVRMALEMKRYPGLNENYRIRTWIESCNRLTTERDFEIADGSGAVIGHARTVWTAIETVSRKPADLSAIPTLFDVVSAKECPIARQGKLPQIDDGSATLLRHDFRYCDFDFNGHVNSTRYIEAMLDLWESEHFDANEIERFEISYLREIRQGNGAMIKKRDQGNISLVEISTAENQPACRARIIFKPRKI